jgi:hypothetical protein
MTPLNWTELEAEITRLEQVGPSIKTLLEKLFAEYAANADAPAKIRELSARGKASVDSLVAAALANTPAEPTPA